MQQEVSASRRALYSVGLAVLMLTAALCGLLALTYAGGGRFGGGRQVAVVLSLLVATVATLAMAADLVDIWLLGRRFSPLSVRMVHLLVFAAMLVAVGFSIVTRTTVLLLVMTPAFLMCLFTVIRPRPQRARGVGPGGRPQTGRQRRGGRKRQ